MRFCLIFLLNAFFERLLKAKGTSFHNLARDIHIQMNSVELESNAE